MCKRRILRLTVKGTRFQALKAANSHDVPFECWQEGVNNVEGIAPMSRRRQVGAWYLDVPLKGPWPPGSLLKYEEDVLS